MREKLQSICFYLIQGSKRIFKKLCQILYHKIFLATYGSLEPNLAYILFLAFCVLFFKSSNPVSA